MKVLIVDDDSWVRENIHELIEGHYPDVEIHFGVDGKHGFEIWKQTLPDIVITDFRMPYWNGEDLAALIRSSGLKQPFIILHCGLLSDTRRYDLFDDLVSKGSDERLKEILDRRIRL